MVATTRSKSRRGRDETSADTTGPSSKRPRSEKEEEEEEDALKKKKRSDLPPVSSSSFDPKPFILGCLLPEHGVVACTSWWERLAGSAYQEDPDIFVQAMLCGLSPAKSIASDNAILKNAQVLTKSFRLAKNRQQAKELWDMIIDKPTKACPTVALAAFDRGVGWSKIPKQVARNKESIKDSLSKGLLRWKRLPTKLKSDVELALCVLGTKDTCFQQVLPHVSDKERLWAEWACVHPGPCQSWVRQAIPWQEAPVSIRSNRKLMLETVSRAAFVTEHIHESLLIDLEYVTSILETNVLALAYMPRTVLECFPAIVLDGVWVQKYMTQEGVGIGDIERLQEKIPVQHWRDGEFARLWVLAGGNLHTLLPAEFGNDEALLLEHAKAVREGPARFWLRYPKNCVSPRLQSDKGFLRRLLEFASPDTVVDLLGRDNVCGDLELFTLVHSRSRNYRGCYGATTTRQVHERLEDQLDAYEGFFKGILCGSRPGSGSPLALLDQGPDGNIKKIIASFLGFPKGEALVWLFQTAANRDITGFNPLAPENALTGPRIRRPVYDSSDDSLARIARAVFGDSDDDSF